jgi:hypothetical protein
MPPPSYVTRSDWRTGKAPDEQGLRMMTQPKRWRDGLSATARLVVEWVGSGAAAAVSLYWWRPGW